MGKFFEGQLFSNLCEAFSAIGTVGAVIVSLYFSSKENRVKYRINYNLLCPLPNKKLFSVIFAITNLSYNKKIVFKNLIYLRIKNTVEPYEPSSLCEDDNGFEITILPWDTFHFQLDRDQIKDILDLTQSKKMHFYFLDISGKKYKICIHRKELEMSLRKENK